MGFDHVAIAAGAGKPTIIDVKNNLIRGVRKASDFLMALQLTGGFKRDSLANLQVRLPAIVIGGGLTGIDTTTEVAAYYPVQVEKFLERWESLAATRTKKRRWRGSTTPRSRRSRASSWPTAGRCAPSGPARRPRARRPTLGGSGRGLGRRRRSSTGAAWPTAPPIGSTTRRSPSSSRRGSASSRSCRRWPAFPTSAARLKAVEFERLEGEGGPQQATGEKVTLPARSLFVAAGTSPNVTYERERTGLVRDRSAARRGSRASAPCAGDDGAIKLDPTPNGEVGFFTSYLRDGRTVSYYGDNNPGYAGSVVRAMASAKDGAPHVEALFADEIAKLAPAEQPARDAAWRAFASRAGRRVARRRWCASNG